jgi:hypothetical protein
MKKTCVKTFAARVDSSHFFIKYLHICLAVFLFSSIVIGNTIHVPADYATIQQAINAAINGDTIIVFPGTYYENINFNGKNIILTSTDPEDPNIVATTIIDGGQNGSVVTFSGSETSACELRGFTIRNGKQFDGGGIYGGGAHATITHCNITNNKADPYNGHGGGLTNFHGVVICCTISSNSAGRGGGFYHCNGTIINCTINSNLGIHAGNGGGLSHCNGSIINCTISGNQAGMGGGLYYCDASITNCIVTSNIGTSNFGSGGGLCYCDGTITNCTITNNVSQGWINTCGGLSHCNGFITNCIIWGNSAVESEDQIYNSSIPAYSCIQDWTGGGTGNISSDPMFIGNFHLSLASGCIDTGINAPPGGLPPTDKDGNPRILHGNVDMGAYEFLFTSAEPVIIVNPKSLSFSMLESEDSPPEDQHITIKNYGNQALNWSIDLSGKPVWLTITPTSGSLELDHSEPIILSVDDVTGLSGGQYSYTFGVSDPLAANSPQPVTVNLTVTGPVLEVSDNEFTFFAPEGVSNPADKILLIQNTGGGTLNWSVDLTGKPDWLMITPINGSLGHNQTSNVFMSVNITGLAEGFYSCLFEVVDPEAQNSPRLITIHLRVGAIHVPIDYPTIQAAINASYNGGIVIVSPGTYYENINFNGKDIILTSTDPNDPDIVASTIINGSQNGSVVTFSGSETPNCVLAGLTITNGRPFTTFNSGGGIYGCGTQATIANCTISGNKIGWDLEGSYPSGGGLSYCNGIIDNCIIIDNEAHYGDGGGLAYCDATITNCLIAGNEAHWGAGLYHCNGTIINCTIVNNSSPHAYGGLMDCNGSITNCIIWQNGIPLYRCSIPSYSCIQNWIGGTGNLSSDPLFADPTSADPNNTDSTNLDYHLKSQYGRWDTNQWVYDEVTSPCIDAGDPEIISYWDPNGTPEDPNDDFFVEYPDPNANALWTNELWPHGGRINMGAYGGTPQASMSANPVGNIADLNHDDAVDLDDLALFCQGWLHIEYLLDTDLNRNGIVDNVDFAVFADQWLWFQP